MQSLAFSSTGILASGGFRTVKLWEAIPQPPLPIQEVPGMEVTCWVMDPSGESYALARLDGSIEIRKTEKSGQPNAEAYCNSLLPECHQQPPANLVEPLSKCMFCSLHPAVAGETTHLLLCSRSSAAAGDRILLFLCGRSSAAAGDRIHLLLCSRSSAAAYVNGDLF